MTLTSQASTAAPPARTEPHPAPAATTPVTRQDSSSLVPAVALTATMLLAVLLGFIAFLFGFSGVEEARHQNTLFKTFSYQLNQALAPVGPTTVGAPVAVLSVPKMGLRNVVVVEGTTSRALTAGPGHLRSTPLPGQAGTSIIFGRRSTYGAPFGNLLTLDVGDVITVTTGQGAAHYRVTSFGSTASPAPANSANRLELITAADPLRNTGYTSVSADLVGKPQPSPGGLPQIALPDTAMHGDAADATVPLLLWAQALLLVAAGGTYAYLRWSRPAAVICLVPVTVAVLWNVFENVAALRPNLF